VEDDMARALVADDDADNRESMRFVLEDEAHEVTLVADGPGALAALRAARDGMVALIDNRMPGLTGIEVLTIAAGDPDLATRHAYLLVTAGVPPDAAPLAPLLAALDLCVVRKPFDIEDLLGAVALAAERLTERAGGQSVPRE
jgi:CheY-like chemotaxis protein